MDNTAKYLAGKDKVEESEVSKFVSDFNDGKLKRTLKSEDLPEDWDKKPVKVLVSSNFKDVALHKNKDVFVEFNAPWCRHCKALAPKWDELGEHFKDSDSVVIAKMDSTANEIEEVTVEGFPTLKLFKKDTNEIVNYDGESQVPLVVRYKIKPRICFSGPREVKNLIKFVETGKVDDEEEEEEEEEEENPDHTEL